MYTAWQEEFAPAVVEKVVVAGGSAGKLTVRVTARKDFPSYTLRDYTLTCNGRTLPLRTLQPGESQELVIDAGGETKVSLVKPGGFVILTKSF
jgi:beta-glucuronidase